MQLSTIFSRANQEMYLLPIERALYKFALTVLIFIPNSALLAGVAFVLTWLHTSLPTWLWVIMAAAIQVLLTAALKYYTAQGDTQVSAAILAVQAGAATDIAGMNKPPEPIILPQSKQPPSA